MKKIYMFSGIILLSSQIIFAQAGRPANPPAKPANQPAAKPAGTMTPRGTPGESSQPDLGLDVRLAGGLAIPLGAISTLGSTIGGGGHLDGELRLPFALGPLELKAGISFGVYGFAIPETVSTLGYSIMMLPILGYAIIAYPIKNIGLTPYLGVGGGGTATSYNSSVDTALTASSFDGTLAFRLGASYALPPVPRLSIILDLSYLIVFEADNATPPNPNNGEMFNIELGVQYRILGK